MQNGSKRLSGRGGLGCFPIQTPILNRLGDMLFADRITAVQVRNRAGHLEDAGVSPGRETEAVGDQFQHAVAGRVQFAIFLDETRRHLGVAVDLGATVALQLQFAGAPHPSGNRRGTFGFAAICQVAVFDRRNFDVDVNPVQKRTGDAGAVAVDRNRRTGAGMGGVGQVAAGAGVC